MNTIPVKRPTARASKDQILAAFDQLTAEYRKLATAQPAPAAHAKAPPAPQAAPPVSAAQGARTRDDSIEETIAALEALRVRFPAASSALSGKLTTEAVRLAELRGEVEGRLKHLAALHGITVTDQTLQELIDQYESTATAFETETSESREAFAREVEARTGEWVAEKEAHARRVAERDEAFDKSASRGATEYEYDLALRRKAEADAYEQQRKAAERELEDTVQARNTAWAEREREIAAREAECAEHRARFEELPGRLEAAVKRARAEGAAIAAGQAKVKADLIAREIDGEKRVFELRIKSLESAFVTRARQIESLSEQLAAALKQAQDLAVKAIEGAANSSSLVAIKEIALEQAKNALKSK